ncbi:unnamed protein product [Medioppia subpectinata]|uniref:Catalase n=1 Tax=Medioppia subpectinata TaxID=1979941 RepID=A0A7R9PZZ2_9ACAR|nr:unnamed protein product [Medioppia subpectinata]CAG2106657.1 unnamed protein product [Medioppia subpectinata]
MCNIFIYISAVVLVISTEATAGNVPQNETHLTGLFGRPVGRKTDLLTAGLHGPALLQDYQFIEEMAHFDRERIPERVVHAKGSGAFGTFRVTNPSMSRYSRMALFSAAGKQTEVAVRFSTVGGAVGSADTVFADPRGFATKFYTEEGNWDLVGVNVPMFFIRDASQFPSLIHANKKNPASGLNDPTALWDFQSLRPETLNLITYLHSDYGIPDGWRHMPGFSLHAFKLVNSQDKHFYVKFHWITNQGIKNLDVDTAAKLSGTDPDYARRDLYDAIAAHQYPSWTLKMQVITEDEANTFGFNPFDATKQWSTVKYPLIEVGVMTLNRNPSNFFAEETHLTGLFGRPVGRKTDLLTAGLHGPALLQDYQFIEEMAHFDRERIPERVVHAKGSGAFGTFRVTNPSMSRYTRMALFSAAGKQTEVAVRFSTVGGAVGSADTVFADPRGFATKFYTEEGNWDLVGVNVPMFFIRDASQFPSLIHANKKNPASGLNDPTALWDFQSLRPETLNLITYLHSDYGIPDGWRHMPGFSLHAFKLVNSQDKHFYVKFHWITNQGIKNLDVDTAAKLSGTDPDYARRDLYDAIAAHQYPSWTLKMQVITEDEANTFGFNPFDATKQWSTEKYPLIEVGVMQLNRNPSNFFAEVEQIAFCPANLVPGIEPSPDLLLAGRLFSYGDSQRYRLGTNHQLLPVNSARNRVLAPTQRDGSMRTDDNMGATANYYPNSFSQIRDNPNYLESNFTAGSAAKRADNQVYRYDDSDDHNYEQPRELYNSFPADWRQRLHKNVATSLSGVTQPAIRDRALNELKKVDPMFANGVRNEMNRLDNDKLQSNQGKTIRMGIPGVAELDLSKGADGLGIGLETVANHGIRGHVGRDGATINIGRTGHHTLEGTVGPNGATVGLEVEGNEIKSHTGLDGADLSVGPIDSPFNAHIGLDGVSIGKGDRKVSLSNPFNLFG